MKALACFSTLSATVKLSKTDDGQYLVEQYSTPSYFDFREFYTDKKPARDAFWECTDELSLFDVM